MTQQQERIQREESEKRHGRGERGGDRERWRGRKGEGGVSPTITMTG